MKIYRTKTSETLRPVKMQSENSPVRTVKLKDGRIIRKLVDKSYLRPVHSNYQSGSRSYVQLLFFLLTIWIGLDFYLFVKGIEGGTPIQRPAGVEGFLPISSFMSFRYFMLTGIVNHIHPSGFFIFVSALLISTILKKGFCSWICPIGYISESLYQFGAKVFRHNFILPRWIDIPLRSLKYLLLSFFIIAVSMMSVNELNAFIYSDYNKVADIKMYLFFAHITLFAMAVFGILILLSIIYKNFWCRYACPYGALLGIMSLISPLKIHRVDSTCIDCGKCADACPSLLPVDRLDVVNSAECTACYDCVEVCPIKNTLKFSVSNGSKGLSQKQYAVLLLGVYFGIVGVAMLFGVWHNSISSSEYAQLFKHIEGITHPF